MEHACICNFIFAQTVAERELSQPTSALQNGEWPCLPQDHLRVSISLPFINDYKLLVRKANGAFDALLSPRLL